MSTSSNRRTIPISEQTQAALAIYAGVQASRQPSRFTGGPVVNLGSGDPAFITPEHIREAAKAAIDAGKTHYERNFDLRVAIAKQFERVNGIQIDPREGLCVTTGAHMALYLLFRAFVSPGDEVIMADPGSYYFANTVANGGIPVTLPLRPERGFQIDPAEIEARITPRTKLICLTNPEAPAASVLRRHDLEAIADIAIRHDLLVVSDELYQEIYFTDERPLSIGALPGMAERTFTVNGVSKAWAMTGWRVGWVAGDPDLMRPLLAVHHLNSITLTSISQFAALAALTGPQGILDEFRAEYRRRRDRLAAGLQRIPGLVYQMPEGTYYFWVDIRSLDISSVRFARTALDRFGVQFNPGTVFGSEGEGYIRLSCSPTDAKVDEGLERLESAVRHVRRG